MFVLVTISPLTCPKCDLNHIQNPPACLKYSVSVDDGLGEGGDIYGKLEVKELSSMRGRYVY